MNFMILLKKIKNTFLTPHWNNYYIKNNKLITENSIVKFNKYKFFFLKNIKVNITIENKIFTIPQIEDL